MADSGFLLFPRCYEDERSLFAERTEMEGEDMLSDERGFLIERDFYRRKSFGKGLSKNGYGAAKRDITGWQQATWILSSPPAFFFKTKNLIQIYFRCVQYLPIVEDYFASLITT